MKTVILAGGFGTRLAEETEVKPKPMIEIGERPILWHIMKYYASYGFKEFVVALGYKGDVIKRYFLEQDFVAPGTFVAAVGADNSEKQELEPALLSRSKVVVDVLEQCVTLGELHHALDAGALTRDEVYGELGEVIAGGKPGRTSADEIIIFDSTGMALQDVGTAVKVYEKAVSDGVGTLIDFAH